jgi:hypothetical protein
MRAIGFSVRAPTPHDSYQKNETENRKNNPFHEKGKGNTLKDMRGGGGVMRIVYEKHPYM